jgi:hypothetical protein
MRRLRLFAIVGVATVCSAGVALATHVPQVDPATVPEGFLAAHNEVEGIRMSSIERAVEDGKADVFIQHARLDPNAATPWHTHPALGTSAACTCRALRGEGFFDRGGGHVHRAVAGAAGAHFYPVYVLPPGSETHVAPPRRPRSVRREAGVTIPRTRATTTTTITTTTTTTTTPSGGKSTDH